MRIKIIIEAEKHPIIYRHRAVSFIKEALKKADIDYKEYLYRGKITKPFCFNIPSPKNVPSQKEEIQIDENFIIEDTVYSLNGSYLSLYVSASDYRFLISLFNGIKRMGAFDFSSDTNMLINGKKISWGIKKVIYLNERPIRSDRIIFKTNSPILVEDINDKPVLFSDKNFEKELNEITDRILRSEHIKGRGLEKPLKFKPLKMNKKVIKHTLKKFREKTGKPIMYLTGNYGIFELSGHPKDLEILYKIGIGNRTGQGFGMVEVVG
ncbi:MAG TPA: CRISPR-associated endoribonuclease Cas6 [Persephonella sp.]|uniref:Crispr-associated protein Cas6 n=1 Tax=Persephonella marina (strain DSM 14350 / EX-H1) TaxID=123214 RepID=C0QR06_PERMH|nr:MULTISPECIES: CRISPR-associated endoribonuclease Cas6 [Persephonella]ACO04364.1 crispr-associated protein Cas6 [Persephonella marina EX-H1]HCB68851.1 CRISPR-associated endoribonuclease Cas6 [Persephonella sp.]